MTLEAEWQQERWNWSEGQNKTELEARKNNTPEEYNVKRLARSWTTAAGVCNCTEQTDTSPRYVLSFKNVRKIKSYLLMLMIVIRKAPWNIHSASTPETYLIHSQENKVNTRGWFVSNINKPIFLKHSDPATSRQSFWKKQDPAIAATPPRALSPKGMIRKPLRSLGVLPALQQPAPRPHKVQ